jgi:ammonia channel protein AmtB
VVRSRGKGAQVSFSFSVSLSLLINISLPFLPFSFFTAGGGGDGEVLYQLASTCNPNWPWIDITLVTMLNAEFATAAVLISFGVLLGTSTPVQLVLMAMIEIVLFNVNEVIGRSYIGARDAGDTIFVHMFGAYFGLAASRVLYIKATTSSKAGANRTSDLFSMIGTVFLWLFWPSFNSGAVAEGDAQMRALINTYLALCACALAAFAVSALVNPQRKFCMVILLSVLSSLIPPSSGAYPERNPGRRRGGGRLG